MVDSARRQRAEPEAVGPPRHRMSRLARNKAERGNRRRRFTSRIVIVLMVVVVVGAVFVGSKLWHSMFNSGDDYTGTGKRDLVIQIHYHPSGKAENDQWKCA